MRKDWKAVRRDRTIRVAEKRVNALLKGFELLGNMVTSHNYQFEDGEIEKIIDVLKEEMEKQFAVLKRDTVFRLDRTEEDDVVET